MNMRRGMVRMRTNGSAREKLLIFTIHRMDRHTIWISVKRCIRNVLTCTNDMTEGCEQRTEVRAGRLSYCMCTEISEKSVYTI